MSEDILIANESFSKRYQGADHAFVKGQTRVRAGHPILKGVENLFVPITPHYEFTETKAAKKPEFEQATSAPNEKRGQK